MSQDLLVELVLLWRSAGGEACVVLGPAERAEEADWRKVAPVVSPPSVTELVAWLSTADGFVGVDSGPSHVAAALGLRGIVFFTLAGARSFAPRGVGVVAVNASPSSSHAALVREAWGGLRGVLP